MTTSTNDQTQLKQTPEQLWTQVLGQLQLQMTQATFDTWVKETHIVSQSDGKWVIGARSAFAKDWLEHKLFVTINRTVTLVMGQPVELEFVVAAGHNGHDHSAVDLPGGDDEVEELLVQQPVTAAELAETDAWQLILARLYEELPGAGVYFNDSYLVSQTAHKLVISTRRTSTGVLTAQEWQEWMQSQVNCQFIHQVAEETLGYRVELKFVLDNRPQANATAGTITTGSLAVDIRTLNRSRYQPLPNYYVTFIEPYLRQKWATAGARSFVLWLQLVARDTQRVIQNKSYQNWTKPVVYRLEELAELLEVSPQELTGRYGYCSRFNEAKAAGQPLAACCHLHQPSEFERERHCHYWRWGILEILSTEGVLAAAENGGRKNHKLTLQVWRSWPLLTPYRVKTFLSAAKQAAHQAWLEKWSGVTGVPFDIWATETAENVIEQFPDRQAGRECPGGFVRNPWRKGQM